MIPSVLQEDLLFEILSESREELVFVRCMRYKASNLDENPSVQHSQTTAQVPNAIQTRGML